jgi:prepilin-type N-terminal cleavage/methylation domain-containing protein/prepilin-type processing-associated H-X9-DG protein
MRRNGLTLIEMLVTITIIVILAALLLPALAAARDAARATTCKSNLRQVWIGMSQYTDTWHGILPPHKWSDPGSMVVVRFGDDADSVVVEQPRWPTILSQYWGGTFDLEEFRELQQRELDGDISGTRLPRDDNVVVNNQILVCPDAPERTTIRNLGYGYNYQFLGLARPKFWDSQAEPETRLPGLQYANYPVGLSAVRVPHRTIAFADSLGSAGEWSSNERESYSGAGRLINSVGNHGYTLDPPRSYTPDWVERPDGGLDFTGAQDFSNAHYGPSECDQLAANLTRMCPVDPRHGGRANVIFLDGHSESLTPEDLGYSMNLNGSYNRNGVTNKLFSGTGTDRNPPPCDSTRLPIP